MRWPVIASSWSRIDLSRWCQGEQIPRLWTGIGGWFPQRKEYSRLLMLRNERLCWLAWASLGLESCQNTEQGCARPMRVTQHGRRSGVPRPSWVVSVVTSSWGENDRCDLFQVGFRVPFLSHPREETWRQHSELECQAVGIGFWTARQHFESTEWTSSPEAARQSQHHWR